MSRQRLIEEFAKQPTLGIRYYDAFVAADAEKHRLINEEWIATKRAMKAEAEVKRLKQQIRDMQMQPEFLFPSIK